MDCPYEPNETTFNVLRKSVMKVNQFAIATIAMLLVGSSLVAQSTSPPQNRAVPAQARQGQAVVADSQMKDQTFAKCLTITNQEQVLMARYAKDKATHPDVKKFAVTLEKEHQNCVEKLNAFSTKYGTKRDATSTSNPPTLGNATDNSNAIDNRKATNTSYTKVEGNSSGVDFLQLHQEMADQCLTDSKAWLNKKEGIEIDKCFVAMQISKHAGMQTSLTVLQRHATGELQSMIKESLTTNAKHLEAAINLMEKLAASDSTKSTRDSQ
jgi:predicted outer membrane protein